MVKSGELSKFALLPPFRNPLVYFKAFAKYPTHRHPSIGSNQKLHPMVETIITWFMLKHQNIIMQDAIRMIRARPIDYLRSINQAVYIYFHSPSDFDLITGNRDTIGAFDLWWNRFFYGQWKSDETSIDRNSSMSVEHVGWWIVVSFLIVAAGSVIFIWKNRRQSR